MSFETITIYRDVPIINKYAQIQPNRIKNKTSVLATTVKSSVSGSTYVDLTGGSGAQYGSGHGSQQFIRLPGLIPGSYYDSDPLDGLV